MVKSTHIGDGVYLSFDGYQLWLAVNHHKHKVVALDPQVFLNLCVEGTKIFQENSASDYKTRVVLSIHRGVKDV